MRSISARRLRAAYVFLMLVGTIAVCAFFVIAFVVRPPLLEVHFLDIGQGDATLVEFPEGGTLLIDGGPNNSVLAAIGKELPWWVRRIDMLIITHPDRDHYAGLHAVVASYDVGLVLVGVDRPEDEYYQLLLSEIRERGIPVQMISRGMHFRSPSGVEASILWPPSGEYDAERNERAAVVLLRWGTVDVLVPSDIPNAVEEELLALEPALDAEVLKVAHHGSRYSSGARFLRGIRARWCIISAGARNRYGHPHPETLARLNDAGCTVLSTPAHGTITVTTDGRTVELETAY